VSGDGEKTASRRGGSTVSGNGEKIGVAPWGGSTVSGNGEKIGVAPWSGAEEGQRPTRPGPDVGGRLLTGRADP